MIRPIFIISKITAIELIRDKIFYLIIAIGFGLLVLTDLFSDASLSEKHRVITHFGFFIFQMTLLFLSLILGGLFWAKEIQRKTLFLFLARPLSRGQIFWGYYFGFLFVLFIFGLAFTLIHALLLDGVFNWISFSLAHLSVFLESLIVLSLVYSFGIYFNSILNFALGLTYWLVGHGQSEIGFYSKLRDDFIHGGISVVTHFLFPHFFSDSFHSVYFISQAEVQKFQLFSLLHTLVLTVLILLIGKTRFKEKDFV